MSVVLPSSDTVSVAPELLHPEVGGIRVEVNGQVLSRGGELWADRLVDTTAARADNRCGVAWVLWFAAPAWELNSLHPLLQRLLLALFDRAPACLLAASCLLPHRSHAAALAL